MLSSDQLLMRKTRLTLRKCPATSSKFLGIMRSWAASSTSFARSSSSVRRINSRLYSSSTAIVPSVCQSCAVTRPLSAFAWWASDGHVRKKYGYFVFSERRGEVDAYEICGMTLWFVCREIATEHSERASPIIISTSAARVCEKREKEVLHRDAKAQEMWA